MESRAGERDSGQHGPVTQNYSDAAYELLDGVLSAQPEGGLTVDQRLQAAQVLATLAVASEIRRTGLADANTYQRLVAPRGLPEE